MTDSILERIELVIGNRVEELARVSRTVDDLGERHGLPSEALADMNVSLDEILSNVLRHAYDDPSPREVRITLTAHSDSIRAEVEDDGRPFDPLAVPPPDRPGSLADSKVGGVGIYFVRNLMSHVAYERDGGKNRLLLVKCFEARRSG
jgi:serine/threonine-protein kinase RsbW